LKPIFGDDVIDTIIENEAKEHNEVAVRPHPHEFFHVCRFLVEILDGQYVKQFI
jgi:hypothetical protein